MGSVGRSAPRTEGPQKLCGTARYVDDYHVPGCLHGVTVRTALPHARIQSIELDPGFDWAGCVVATARDIPGENAVVLLTHDQPLLVDTVSRHAMEPVALVAHADRARAYEAAARVRVHTTPLPAALTIDAALARTAAVHGDDNVFKEIVIERGDVGRGFAVADHVVEGAYYVPHQEQAYIENNGIIAWIEDDGTVVVMGSMQCPYYVHKALKAIFALPDDRIRVIQATTGGGFGGKEEYPNLIAGHAAILARKAGRPVRIVYDRHEDMAATTKRHPARITHRTGVDQDGRLVAQDIDIVMDGGAYTTLSPVVLSRGALHATGPYTCPNVRVRARVVATNTPPNGAFRGFGAPQTLFAAEMQLEKIAATLGLDALVVRRRNMVRRGSVLATGQALRESVGARAVLDAVIDRSRYRPLQREHAAWNRDPSRPTWRGAGLSLVFHGAGFTGRGEVVLNSRASVVLMRDGHFKALAASTEIGQGATTTFVQMTADALGVSADWVEVENPDTWKVPNSGPTVASRTVMIVGSLLQQAAADLRVRVVGARGAWPRTRAAMAALARRACGSEPFLRADADYRPPPGIVWDEDAYRGDAYGVYSYAAAVVDLEVDRATFEVTVRRLTTAQDIGRAINPLLVEGQIIGGTAQGLGYALLELPVYRDGIMQNAQLTNYIIPTAPDMPPVDVVLIEQPYSQGPGGGAKGVGELPMDVPAPAVAAAVWRATNAWLPEIPLLPERIAAALKHPHPSSPPPAVSSGRRRAAAPSPTAV